MSFHFSTRSKQRRAGVCEELIVISDAALRITPIDFGFPEFAGLRTAEEQFALHQAGLSELDGFEKESYHQTGYALDFYAYVDGKASWAPEHLAVVAAAFFEAYAKYPWIAREFALEWGGLWTNPDMPHMQLVRRADWNRE
jgi:peptidoglycan L-alanyl-D-glutamate endopeptidase CwlK